MKSSPKQKSWVRSQAPVRFLRRQLLPLGAAEAPQKCEEELTIALGQPVQLKLDDPNMKPYKGEHATLKSYMDVEV